MMNIKWDNIEKIEKIIKHSITKTDVLNKLGLKNNGGNYNTLKYFIKKNNIDISHFIENRKVAKGAVSKIYYNIHDILIENSPYKNRTRLKERLYKEGLKKRK
jgi:hypothetical protein